MKVKKEFRDQNDYTTLDVEIVNSESVMLLVDDEEWDCGRSVNLGRVEAYDLAMFILKNL